MEAEIKDEIVLRYTAILAKQKGFDVLCDHFYDNNKSLQETDYRDVSMHNSVLRDDKAEMCTAPTQSLLQHWLRKKRNLHIEVKVQDYVDNPQYYWSIFGQYKGGGLIRCLENSEDKFRVGMFPTYESALEMALQAALEMLDDFEFTNPILTFL